MQGKVDSRRGGVIAGLQTFQLPLLARCRGTDTNHREKDAAGDQTLFEKQTVCSQQRNAKWQHDDTEVRRSRSWWTAATEPSKSTRAASGKTPEQVACPAHAGCGLGSASRWERQFTFLLVYDFFVLWLCENYVIFIQFIFTHAHIK